MPRTKVVTPAATSPQLATGAEQIYQRAHDELTRLQAVIAHLESVVATSHQCLDEIDQARETREQCLEALRAQVQREAAAHTQAIHYAALATGTVNEVSSIASASASQQELETAQRDLVAAEQQNEEVRQAEASQETQLIQDLETAQAQLATARQELQQAQALTQRTGDELGEETYDQLVAGYEERARQVDQLRAQLVAAQMGLYDYHDQALHTLDRWPALRREIDARREIDDATTRTMSALLCSVEALASGFTEIDATPLPSLKVNSPVYSGYRDLRQELITLAAEVVEILRSQRQPGAALVELADRLKRLLAEYRIYRRECTY